MNKLKTPYELFGIECGEGWKDLYQPILDKIYEINKETGKNIVPTQIKEKFGRLEVYLNETTPELTAMIQEASEKSSHVCENCGKPAEAIKESDGWIYQFCDECYNKYCEHFKEIIESYENQFESREENISEKID